MLSRCQLAMPMPIYCRWTPSPQPLEQIPLRHVHVAWVARPFRPPPGPLHPPSFTVHTRRMTDKLQRVSNMRNIYSQLLQEEETLHVH